MTLVGRRALNHPQQTGRRGALDAVDDRRTPAWLFSELDREFHFTLDVAASDKNALCRNYFTREPEHDGLELEWFGSVWCNPPYSDCGAWAAKARAEHARGVGPIVMLLPANRTEQRWWQEHVEPFRREGSLEVRFVAGRLRFDTPPGTYSDPRGNRPPFGVCLVIWPAPKYASRP